MAIIPLLRLTLRPKTTTHHHSTTHSQPPLSSSFLYHPIKQPLFKPQPLKRTSTSISMSLFSSPTPSTDHLISSLTYFLTLINGLQYGHFIFPSHPSLSLPFQPIFPIISLFKSLSFASFIAFFTLYLGVVRNPSFSRYVRFNGRQAIVLDMLLMLVQRILGVGGGRGRGGFGFKCMVFEYIAVFVFMILCFVYNLVCTVLGKTPYLPLVADAADSQF